MGSRASCRTIISGGRSPKPVAHQYLSILFQSFRQRVACQKREGCKEELWSATQRCVVINRLPGLTNTLERGHGTPECAAADQYREQSTGRWRSEACMKRQARPCPRFEGLVDKASFLVPRRSQPEDNGKSVLSLSLRACHPLS